MVEDRRSVIPYRVAIMGNGGSGKTWLAKRLASKLGTAPTHLDQIRWEPGRIGLARDKALVADEVRQLADASGWVIEGVYGWLINIVLPRTTLLILLDLPDGECMANIMARGKQGGESDEAFAGLLDWVSKYRQRRNNWNSYESHLRMFDGFQNEKVRLRSRTEITAYADRFARSA